MGGWRCDSRGGLRASKSPGAAMVSCRMYLSISIQAVFTSVLLVITRRDSLVVLTSALSRARLVETWNALVESSWNSRGMLSWNPREYTGTLSKSRETPRGNPRETLAGKIFFPHVEKILVITSSWNLVESSL